MVEKIEVSMFKPAIIIIGILSFIFNWYTWEATLSFFGASSTFHQEINFLGETVKISIDGVDHTPSGMPTVTELQQFGFIYLLGFLISAGYFRINEKESLKFLGLIGFFLMLLGIIGYIVSAYVNAMERVIATYSDPILKYFLMFFDFSVKCEFMLGVYLALVTVCLVALEISIWNQYYFTIDLSKSKKEAQAPIVQARPQEIAPIQIPHQHPIQETPVTGLSFCPACGKEVKEKDMKFCANCGREFN